jgi:hypothetical protein
MNFWKKTDASFIHGFRDIFIKKFSKSSKIQAKMLLVTGRKDLIEHERYYFTNDQKLFQISMIFIEWFPKSRTLLTIY